jgi:hypothetical protein
MPNVFQVGIETPLGLYVGVAHMVANLGFFPAYITLSRHDALRKKYANVGQAYRLSPKRGDRYTALGKKASLFLTRRKRSMY